MRCGQSTIIFPRKQEAGCSPRFGLWCRLRSPLALMAFAGADCASRVLRGDRETGSALSENTIYKGTARDGSVLMREFDRGRTLGLWRYEPWPKEYENRAGHVVACTRARSKNIKAMQEFLKAPCAGQPFGNRSRMSAIRALRPIAAR